MKSSYFVPNIIILEDLFWLKLTQYCYFVGDLRNWIKQKLCNMSLGEKSKKKKVKIRTQHEKIVETDMGVWY